MFKSLHILAAASVILAPLDASAGNQFATAETSYQSDGMIIVSTLYATAGQEPVDGDYIFEGYVLQTTEGIARPWTVRVPEELEAPSVVAAQAISDDRIVLQHSYRFEIEGVSVEKSFFEVRGEEANGTMVVTDDPLPLVGWLVIGGAATILGTVGLYMTQCDRIQTKGSVSSNGTVTYETSCDIPR